MVTEETMRRIAELVEKYEYETNKRQSEADVRAGYIDLLFLALGWNVYNNPGEFTNYRREDYIRGAGYVDVGLEIAGQPALMLEAKKFGELPRSTERTYDRTLEEKQLFRYARGRKIPYCILTNFERLQVFNADHERLILWFNDVEEYLRRLPELLHLSAEKVQAGSLPATERQLEIKDIDDAFLTSLQDWRLRLANAIYEHNADKPVLKTDESFDFSKLMAAVQRILDRLILIRYADDKEVLRAYDVMETILSGYYKKGAYTRPDYLIRELVDFSNIMDDHHNTTLFQPGHICEQVFIPNDSLEKIMSKINNISFRKFTSDILGNTYETYLGTKLVLKNGVITSEERRDIRKAGGIYYTPPMVVHYIVDNTLGHLLNELKSQHGLHAIDKAQEIRVLDPACGSGSFLIYAYQVLASFYRRMNEAIEEERVKLLTSGAGPDMFDRLELFKQLPQPLLDHPHHILEKQLYGVDIDPEAAEITAVNLTMRAFADTRREKLPLILNQNIKVGNSLISGTDEELQQYFGDKWVEKQRFNWEDEFREIMRGGGFDVVIGNPPYGAELTGHEKSYLKSMYPCVSDYETAQYFMVKAEQLLKDQGHFAFIVPNTIFLNLYARKLRHFVASSFKIESLLDLSDLNVFKKATIRTIIPLLIKSSVRNAEITFLRFQEDETEISVYKTISQKDLMANDGLWSTSSTSVETTLLIERIKTKSIPLKNILEISQGLIPYDKYRGHDEETIRNRVWHADQKKNKTFKRELRGGDVRRYMVEWNGKRWISYGPWLAAPRKKEFFTEPRLLFREITDPRTGLLNVAFSDEEYYNNPSLINCIASGKLYSLKYCLGIADSKLIAYLHFHTSPKVRKGVFPKILVNDVRNLPIRCIDFNNPEEKRMHDGLVALVDKMLYLNNRLTSTPKTLSNERDKLQREIERTDGKIDNLVYDLYGLTQEEREIVKEQTKVGGV